MKKLVYFLSILFVCGITISSCARRPSGTKEVKPVASDTVTKVIPAIPEIPEYTVLDLPQTDISSYKVSKDSFITLFDGKTFTGWRGYCKEDIPKHWTIEDGMIKINASETKEVQSSDNGDIIFAHKFNNFELTIDWKVSEGGNSGIFYLAREINDQPIGITALECQILDNENNPDAKLGAEGNHQSSSIYDLYPAKPQNAKPFGEWNTTKIIVFNGKVVHYQNEEKVLEAHLWTNEWTERLQKSKYNQKEWPLAFELLSKIGGEKREGYIGLQDHNDDVWFKNIKIRIIK